MTMFSPADWGRVDILLAESHLLLAVKLYRELTGCGVAEAKAAVGERFRVRFPHLWREYRDIGDED